MPLNCTIEKQSSLLRYKFSTLPAWLGALTIENSHYFFLDIRVLQPPAGNSSNYTKFYLGYSGRDVSYSGLNIARKDYHSPVLPFGAFYKTQVAPFIVRTIENVWQFGLGQLDYATETAFHFEGGAPYFSDPQAGLDKTGVRIFFKYNNDNNPFTIATISVTTMMGGLTIIGGYVKIFGLLKIALYFYNKRSFENRIFKEY